jgi:hypothetical protein
MIIFYIIIININRWIVMAITKNIKWKNMYTYVLKVYFINLKLIMNFNNKILFTLEKYNLKTLFNIYMWKITQKEALPQLNIGELFKKFGSSPLLFNKNIFTFLHFFYIFHYRNYLLLWWKMSNKCKKWKKFYSKKEVWSQIFCRV